MIRVFVDQPLPSPWARHRLAVLLGSYGEAENLDARRFAAQQLRDFVRVNPELIDLIPGEVWTQIYRVRAAGTVAP